MAPGESIQKIANGYHCSVGDIVSCNQHITDYYHLSPGMKIKIPFITKEKIEILEETEPFISDYYPTYNGELLKKQEEPTQEPVEENTESPLIIHEDVKKVEVKPAVEGKVNSYPFNPYSQYFGNVVPKYNQKYIRKI